MRQLPFHLAPLATHVAAEDCVAIEVFANTRVSEPIFFLAFERPDTGALEVVELDPHWKRYGTHFVFDGVFVLQPVSGRRRPHRTGVWSLMQFHVKQARGAMCIVW